jgi:hypothetical protein
MSVAFGILRGLWLVTVDWIKACAEAGHYVPEEDYEIIDWYPKCTHTRILASTGSLPGATLLTSRRIYIGKTMFDRQLVQKLTSECGATVRAIHFGIMKNQAIVIFKFSILFCFLFSDL